MLIQNVNGITWQDKLNTLSYCNCCSRHQIDKPRFFQTWIDTPFNFKIEPHFCKCNCRHLARAICRQTYDYDGIGLPAKPLTPTSIIQ